MTDPMSRRGALKAVISAGTMAMIAPAYPAVAEMPISVQSAPADITITPISEHTVRVTVQRLRDGNPIPLPSDGAVVEREWGTAATRIRSLDGPRTITSGELVVTLSPGPLTIRIAKKIGGIVQNLAVDATSAELSFNIAGGLLLGLGQGGPQFDRRGHVDSMVSGQGGYELGTHGARVPVQFLIGTSGWGMFIHAPSGRFDFTGEQGRLQAFEKQAVLPVDVFIIGASEPAEIMREYAKITGFPEMPPLWSFGYQQSHRTLDSPEQPLAEARKFREKKLPCDAMIYLGTGFCPNGWNTNNGEFTWNPRAFPDPPKAIEQLHADHFKVALHVVLEVRRLSGTV